MQLPLKYHLPRIGVVVVTILIVGFAIYQGRSLIEGPVINVISPQNGLTTDDALLPITGTTKNAKDLRLDGRAIFIDTEGRFAEKLLLMYGYNIIELTATDVRGKTTTTTLEVVYR